MAQQFERDINKDKLSSRDKVTQKMSRDGLVEQNQTTGETSRISNRAADYSLKKEEKGGRYYQHTSEPTSSSGHRRKGSHSISKASNTASLSDRRSENLIPHGKEDPRQDRTDAAIPCLSREKDGDFSVVSDSEQRYDRKDSSHHFSDFTRQRDDADNAGLEAKYSVEHKSVVIAEHGLSRLRYKAQENKNGKQGDHKRKSRLQFEREKPQSNNVSPNNTPTLPADKADIRKEAPLQESGRLRFDKPPSSAILAAKPIPDRIRFSAGKPLVEKPTRLDYQIERAQTRLLKTDEKLDAARTRLLYEGASGRSKLRFSDFTPEKDASDGNVGLEARDSAMRTAARGTDMIRDVRRRANSPVRRVTKLERRKAEQAVNADILKWKRDNPAQSKNAFSTALQKQQIKRRYQRQAREAIRNVRNTTRAATRGGRLLASGGRLIKGLLRSKGTLIALCVLLGIILLFAAFSACSAFLSATLVSVFPSEDEDISEAALYWSEMETELREMITYPEEYWDLDEFDEIRFMLNGEEVTAEELLEEIKEIDPFAFISLLSALYEDFKFTDIMDVIEWLFKEVYGFEAIETIETRYDDPDDPLDEGYDWYVLILSLDTKAFEDVVRNALQEYDTANGDEKENLYDLYMESGGGHQSYGNPLGYDWRSQVTSRFGYRQNPTGVPGSDNHTGMDIGIPTGTPLYSLQDGTVITSGWHSLYGWTIVVEDSKGNQFRFAHCDSLVVGVGAKVRIGDLIARSGNSGNSTGPHVHIEIRQNGTLLNPEFLIAYNMP